MVKALTFETSFELEEKTLEEKDLEVLAEEINFYFISAQLDILKVGKRLIVARNKVNFEGGKFELWVENNLKFSVKTALSIIRTTEQALLENTEDVLREIGVNKFNLINYMTPKEKKDFIEKEHMCSSGAKKGKDLCIAEIKSLTEKEALLNLIPEFLFLPEINRSLAIHIGRLEQPLQRMLYEKRQGNGSSPTISIKEAKDIQHLNKEIAKLKEAINERDEKLEKIEARLREKYREIESLENTIASNKEEIKRTKEEYYKSLELTKKGFEIEKTEIIKQKQEIERKMDHLNAELARRINGCAYPKDYEEIQEELKRTKSEKKALKILNQHMEVKLAMEEALLKGEKVKKDLEKLSPESLSNLFEISERVFSLFKEINSYIKTKANKK